MTELQQAANEAKAAHDAAVQARRLAEFEHITATAAAKEANQRMSKTKTALDAAREAQYAASKAAD